MGWEERKRTGDRWEEGGLCRWLGDVRGFRDFLEPFGVRKWVAGGRVLCERS